jgi:hypothetical protein
MLTLQLILPLFITITTSIINILFTCMSLDVNNSISDVSDSDEEDDSTVTKVYDHSIIEYM